MLPSLGLIDPSLKVRVCKVLRSNPGVGPQLLHSDVPSQAKFLHPITRQTQSKQEHSFAFIIHLDEISWSTHVPNPAWSSQGDFSLTGACKQIYTSYAMACGDMLIFRSDLPHAGPANPSDQTRYVLFLMVTPEVGEGQDAKQEYFKC
jgi:ectoine hydroxylase-related dioxygenase (phytanoyl-CoA dioxygenase family)